MSRLNPIDPATATGKAKQLLDGVQAKLGITPNMMKAMAQSPAVLDGYLSLSNALAHGSFNAGYREELALTVAEANGCEYCLSAHTAFGSLAGLQPEQLENARLAKDPNHKNAAGLLFAKRVNETRGEISEADFATVRAAGFSEGEIAELLAHVALNVFTNYFNIAAATEVDFPRVKPATAGL
ncbi:MAG: carboxymuconolactone decarboxylase family protein [Bryobacteraceae bacterium]|nr:carboxymuconolactone decarboxylase family protein [Bryobacteraceae bacterium]